MAGERKAVREAVATTRLALIAAGKRTFKAAVFPGLDLPVKLAVLSCSDVQECYAAALARFADLGMGEVTVATLDPFQDELATQVLLRAVRDAEDTSKPVAESAEDLRDHTTVDQRASLFELYMDFQHECDPDLGAHPNPRAMSPAEVAEIDELVKKKDARRLRALGSASLASYLLTTASLPSTSPTDRSGAS